MSTRRSPQVGRTLRILGVMTGTSCDGLDATAVEFDIGGETSWRVRGYAARPFPAALRARVLALQAPGSRWTTRQFLELDRDLGDWFAKSLRDLQKHPKLRTDLIANHGQTVAHFPQPGARGVTLQLGSPARIATATGLTVLSHFRDGDMAAGGQGAPLLPLFHRLMARRVLSPTELRRGVAIHNLGGISNLTYLDPNGTVLAFDTGPSNAWIDEAVQILTNGRAKMDRGGKLARAGESDPRALARLLKHPFLKLAPPKSTGRDDFPFQIFRAATAKREHWVSTATDYTVESVARGYERWILNRGRPLARVLICGGGAKNPELMRRLRERLAPAGVDVSSIEAACPELGLEPQMIESAGFAVFAYRSLQGRPLGGEWTGARGFGPPAQITPGINWAALIPRLASLAQR